VIGGTVASRVASQRSDQLGGSYSAQRYLVGTGSLALPASEGSRAAGSMFFADRWTLSPHVTLDYVARYSKYGYLAGPGLFSPRVSVTIAPAVHTRVVATVSRRMLAPGAEEFLPAITPGLWVPPARSFDRLSPGESFTAERTLHYEVAVERDFAHRYVVSVRGFRQRVHDQRTALFDLGLIPGATGDSSHYAIARVGDVSATGWSVGVSDMLGPYVRGSVNYEFASTRWFGPGDLALLAALAPSVVRPATEQIQDLNTSLETDIPVTATRLVVLYRVNTAFARGDRSAAPGLGDRFDVQVTQRLPFLDFTSAQWQVLVAVRNMFRDPGQYGSLYDELLVVEPPKRIVGGVLVRF
jgi:hypothetical protein